MNTKHYFFLFLLLILSSLAQATQWCYQESANVSNQSGTDGNCGLKYSGKYTLPNTCSNYLFNASCCFNMIDGNWTTGEYSMAFPSHNYFYVNYSVPTGATSLSLWQVKDEYAMRNVSLPLDCWNASLSLLRVDTQQGMSPSFQCYNYSNSTWIEIYKNSTGTSSWFYEDAMSWSIINLSSCLIVPSPADTTTNLSVNATGEQGNWSYRWFNSSGLVFSTSKNVSPQIAGQNITVECTLNNSGGNISLNSSTLMINDTTPPTFTSLQSSFSGTVGDTWTLNVNLSSADTDHCYAEIQYLPLSYLHNDTMTKVSGTQFINSHALTTQGMWTNTYIYCWDGSNNSANLSSGINVTAIPATNPGSGGGSSTTIYNIDPNFTSSPAQVYEIFVYPLAGQNWTYALQLSRVAVACNVSAPFTCKAEGSTLYLTYPFNDSIGAYGDIKGMVQANDALGNIMRTPIQVTYINAATYIPVHTNIKIDIEPLFTTDSLGNIIGLKVWWILLVLLYASTKYK